MNPATELETARIDELLGELRELQAQFDLVRERLRRADEHRGTVARRIYDRVRSDYDRELDAIRARLTPLRDEMDRLHESLEAQCREAGAAAHAIEEELAEAEFRHRIGEYEPVAFDEMRHALDARAAEARSRQNTLQSALDAIAAARAMGTPAAPVATTAGAEEPAVSLASANVTVDAYPVSSTDDEDFSSLVVDEPPSLERRREATAWREAADPTPEVADEDDAPVALPEPPQEILAEPSHEADLALAELFPEAPDAAPAAEVAAPVHTEVAPPAAVTAAAAPRKEGFENPQAWVSEMGKDGARPERRVRLSAPSVAPVRAAAIKDEFDSALAHLDTHVATVAPASAPAPAAVSAPVPMASLPSLVFVSGPHAGQAIALLPTTLTIGREHDNNVEIKDADVARYHARILRERDTYVVEDLNSSTGTWVNGERKNRAALSHGDVIRVGQTELALDYEWTTDSR